MYIPFATDIASREMTVDTVDTVDTEETFLNDCWMLYFHDPDNNDWTPKSYNVLQTLSTAEDWVGADSAFRDMWQRGMFFLMREHIQPLWEDENNKHGGCLSFKVNKPDASEYWFQLGCKLLGEVLGRPQIQNDHICGISISPKRNYCILRVWLRSSEHTLPELYHLEAPYYSQVIYKPHTGQKDYETQGTL